MLLEDKLTHEEIEQGLAAARRAYGRASGLPDCPFPAALRAAVAAYLRSTRG